MHGTPTPCLPCLCVAGPRRPHDGTGSQHCVLHAQAKTGIANRMLRPLLGIVDPENMATMPPEVAAASGFDVLCHSLESFTAIPYNMRTPRPTNPNLR